MANTKTVKKPVKAQKAKTVKQEEEKKDGLVIEVKTGVNIEESLPDPNEIIESQGIGDLSKIIEGLEESRKKLENISISAENAESDSEREKLGSEIMDELSKMEEVKKNLEEKVSKNKITNYWNGSMII